MTVIGGDDLAYRLLPGRRSADPLAGVSSAASVRLVLLKPVEGRRPHRHPQSDEVVYVIEGRGRIWVDGVFTSVGPGAVVHIPAGAAHATVPDDEMELVCFFPHPTVDTEELDTELEER